MHEPGAEQGGVIVVDIIVSREGLGVSGYLCVPRSWVG